MPCFDSLICRRIVTIIAVLEKTRQVHSGGSIGERNSFSNYTTKQTALAFHCRHFPSNCSWTDILSCSTIWMPPRGTPRAKKRHFLYNQAHWYRAYEIVENDKGFSVAFTLPNFVAMGDPKSFASEFEKLHQSSKSFWEPGFEGLQVLPVTRGTGPIIPWVPCAAALFPSVTATLVRCGRFVMVGLYIFTFRRLTQLFC